MRHFVTIALGLAMASSAFASFLTTSRPSAPTAETSGSKGCSINSDGTKVAFWTSSAQWNAAGDSSGSSIILATWGGSSWSYAKVSYWNGEPIPSLSFPKISRDGKYVVFMGRMGHLDRLHPFVYNVTNATGYCMPYSKSIFLDLDEDPGMSVSNQAINDVDYGQAVAYWDDGQVRVHWLFMDDFVTPDLTPEALDPNDTIHCASIFAEEGIGGSYPSISANARLLSFSSGAAIEYYGLDGYTQQILVSHFEEVNDPVGWNVTYVASTVDGTSGEPGDANSDYSSISADGSRVAFQSDAMNLDPDNWDQNEKKDIYVRDLDTSETTEAYSEPSPPNSMQYPVDDSTRPAISGDGNWVVFETKSGILLGSTSVTPAVVLCHLTSSGDFGYTGSPEIVTRHYQTNAILRGYWPCIGNTANAVGYSSQDTGHTSEESSNSTNWDVYVKWTHQ